MYNPRKKWSVGAVILFVLLAIGIVMSFIGNLFDILLPIVILGGIFLLYKYPPSFLKGQRSASYKRTTVTPSRSTAAKTRRDRPRSKTVPFRVIEGGKDDDNLPKYH
ncbi:hypothetical protein ACFQZE_02125 [Paenibacillus sp. GCM10027627]|uniref:hypothetical protein n=1 Tax=unclassified Paenibacillus TaxID=185978 RepID=UPI00363AB114